MTQTILILAAAQSVIFGGAAAIVASTKSRDPLGWFILGALFSLVGLLVICAIPAAAKPRQRQEVSNGFSSRPLDPERPWLG